MLPYLTVYLLHTPLRVLIAALAAAIAGGAIGWLHSGRKITAAWTHVGERETGARQHAYRDPLRTASILRPPLVVTAAAISGYALWIGHASWLAVAVDAARQGRVGAALFAVGFFGVGALTAHSTHRLVTGGPEPRPEVRRRAVSDGARGLAVFGAMAVVLVAVMLGAFDGHAVEVRGLKGFTENMSLGEIRERLPEQLVFLSAGGFPLIMWHALGVWALANAVGSIVHSILLLLVARAARDPSADKHAPRLPWYRRWWWLFPGAGVAAALLGGGLFVTRCVPVITAKVVYAEVRPVCLLPDLPPDASELQGRHRVDLMSEDAFVQFRTSDPEGYAAPLLAAGYSEVKPAGRGGMFPEPDPGFPAPAKSVRHFRNHKEYSRQPGVFDAATLCDVHVDSASGLVRVWMWAGD